MTPRQKRYQRQRLAKARDRALLAALRMRSQTLEKQWQDFRKASHG